MEATNDVFDAATGAVLPRVIDWTMIEAQYASSERSVRDIAQEHGISHTAINKKARENNWLRDLRKHVRAVADRIVSREISTDRIARRASFQPGNQAPEQLPVEVASETVPAEVPRDEGDELANEKQAIHFEAAIQARVRLAQHKDISRARSLTAGLLSELELLSIDPALVEEWAQMMRDGETESDRAREVYKKMCSTPGRIDMVKKLVETMRLAFAMEREAYGLDRGDPADDAGNALTALLKGMRRSTLPIVADVEADDGL